MYESVEKVSWICLLFAIIAPEFIRLFVFVIVLPNYSQHISFFRRHHYYLWTAKTIKIP